MKRAHKIRIYPNNVQTRQLVRHCGCARLAYNVCLSQWNADYEHGVKHNYYSIKKWFNGIKAEQYVFVYDVSKWALEAAIADLDRAFKNFYAKRGEHPKFHKKGIHDSFRIDGSVVKIQDCILVLPKGLNILMAEALRYIPTKIYNVTISRRAGMWFASVQCEVPESENQADGAIGVDLGIKSQAVLSDGMIYPNLGIRKEFERGIAHAQRNVMRKQRRSRNRVKARRKLAKLYYRMECKRNDNIHKFTAEVTRKYGTICLEDLNVSGMMKNHHLAGSIADVSFGEIRRQFEYKANAVRFAGRYEPTSKMCSICGHYQHEMPLSIREWVCPACGTHHDRDVNAAINILRAACPEVMPVEGAKRSVKQESNITPIFA